MRKKILAFILILSSLTVLSACGEATRSLTTVELTAQEAEAEVKYELTGQWYGYWTISDCTKQWKSLEASSWDCCAQVTKSGEEIQLLLWDEDMPKNNYLAKLLLEESDNGYSCTGGDFLDVSVAVGNAKVEILDSSGELLVLSGKYEDSSTGSFYYTFYMRPWGEKWPEDGQTPSYYQEWYLPMIQAGESAPDEINK